MPSESGSEVGLYGSRGQRDASRLVKDSKLGAIRGSRILPPDPNASAYERCCAALIPAMAVSTDLEKTSDLFH